MPYDICVAMPVHNTFERRGIQRVKRNQIPFERAETASGFRGHSVEFTPIACGKYERLFEDSLRTQFRAGSASLIGAKRHAFAQFHGRGAMAQSDQYEFNCQSLLLNFNSV